MEWRVIDNQREAYELPEGLTSMNDVMLWIYATNQSQDRENQDLQRWKSTNSSCL